MGKGRQRFPTQHIRENRLKLRHDEHQQETKNQDRDKKNDDRIKHRRYHLVLDLLCLLLELRKAQQDQFEHAAKFAGFHHIDVKLAEYSGVPSKAFRKCAAPLNSFSQADDHFPQHGIGLLLGQHSQSTQKGETRVDQRRNLPSENHQGFRLDRLSLEKRKGNV